MTDLPCRICKKKMGLRSRAIAWICMNCEIQLNHSNPAIKKYFQDKFGVMVFDGKSKFVVRK